MIPLTDLHQSSWQVYNFHVSGTHEILYPNTLVNLLDITLNCYICDVTLLFYLCTITLNVHSMNHEQCSQKQVPARRIAPQHLDHASTLLWFSFALFPLFFLPFFLCFLCFLPFFLRFLCFSLFCCLVPLFFLYYLCFYAWFLCYPSIFSIYFSQLYQKPTDPTYEPCYVPRVYVLSPANRSYVGSRS